VNLGALPPNPRGFSGMGGRSGYSVREEVGKRDGFPGRNIRRNLIRLSLDESLPSVARLRFTGQLEV